MPSPFATAEGTERYRHRFAQHAPYHFYRNAQDSVVSSLGIGSYLGEMDERTSRGYVESIEAALRGGINFVDTSLNYRNQLSERNIGQALAGLLAAGVIARDEIVVCTKAGYLVPGAVPDGISPGDVAGGMHCMSPGFLADQLARSLANLGLESIDVLYLHNPETQLQYVPREVFDQRIHAAFAALERFASEGRIRFYGVATWSGLRANSGEGLSVTRLAQLAVASGGERHRFRFIQLPLNLAMLEGASLVREPWNGARISTLDAASRLGITAIASASTLQTRLASGLPDRIREQLPGLATDAQRAIQFARSAPGITTALVGMSNPLHVEENLKLAGVSPANLSSWFLQNP
jgi:aryl-alcohol dehydrogenase-like predicted oxidoreductase